MQYFHNDGVYRRGFLKYMGWADTGLLFFFFQAEDGIRDIGVTGVQTCALPISLSPGRCRKGFPLNEGIADSPSKSRTTRSITAILKEQFPRAITVRVP